MKEKHEEIKEYYGKELSKSEDLKTNACCTMEEPAQHIKVALSNIHDEVMMKYYGCGLAIPSKLEGLRILDLGSGSGRDCYILSQLVGHSGEVIGVDMTDEQLEESLSLFEERYINYATLYEAFGRARLRQNLAKMGHDVNKVHSQNVKDAEAAKKRRQAASKDLSSYRSKHALRTEEPANNVGSGNIAGMDGGHMSKAQQKAWTSKNKSKKKTLKDMMKYKT